MGMGQWVEYSSSLDTYTSKYSLMLGLSNGLLLCMIILKECQDWAIREVTQLVKIGSKMALKVSKRFLYTFHSRIYLDPYIDLYSGAWEAYSSGIGAGQCFVQQTMGGHR